MTDIPVIFSWTKSDKPSKASCLSLNLTDSALPITPPQRATSASGTIQITVNNQFILNILYMAKPPKTTASIKNIVPSINDVLTASRSLVYKDINPPVFCFL